MTPRRKFNLEINIDESQVMRVSRSNESLWIKVGNREQRKNYHLKYLRSALTKDGCCTREIKMRIALMKEILNRKKISLLTSNINLRKKLVAEVFGEL